MTNEEVDPIVPDLRGRNRKKESPEKTTVDEDGIREEIDALEREAPFVPTVAERRRAERVRDAVGADD